MSTRDPPPKSTSNGIRPWRGAGRRIAYMGVMTDKPMPPERPKVEPEIIPPGERGPQPRGESWMWTSSGRGYGRTVRFETRGALTLFTALLMLGLGTAVV